MRIRWRGLELPNRLLCDKETQTDEFGRFTVEPFERGFGTTIGNSLRRVLLSSLEGFAISAVRIGGVDHEFATIRGVVEDVVDIILNLKQVRLKNVLNDDSVKEETIYMKIRGKDIFTDGDIE